MKSDFWWLVNPAGVPIMASHMVLFLKGNIRRNFHPGWIWNVTAFYLLPVWSLLVSHVSTMPAAPPVWDNYFWQLPACPLSFWFATPLPEVWFLVSFLSDCMCVSRCVYVCGLCVCVCDSFKIEYLVCGLCVCVCDSFKIEYLQLSNNAKQRRQWYTIRSRRVITHTHKHWHTCAWVWPSWIPRRETGFF